MDNYVGEIRIFAGNFAPANWMFCLGQLLPISEHEALFSLIGTTYGGDGTTDFALPNLMGRVALGQGVIEQGTTGGVENITLTALQMPAHQHPIATSQVNAIQGGMAQTAPTGAYYGDQGTTAYATSVSGQHLNAETVSGQTNFVGGAQPHNNIQPVMALNYIIALEGIYPPLQ